MYLKFLLIPVVLLITSSACSGDVARLEFDGTTLCIPAQFVPGLSRFGQTLEENVDGFDDSGGSEILRFPASFIKSGVPSYTLSHQRYREVLDDYFEFEHKVSGIAYRKSYVGNPHAIDGSCFKSAETCSQTLVYEKVVYIYDLHESDMNVALEVKSFLASKFNEWDQNCKSGSQ